MPLTRYWLFKTEPTSFSISDLAALPKQTTCWDGVRNYQARNFMRDQMRVGDLVLFYHSSTDPQAIVGCAKVVRTAYPDSTAWDPKDHHYDPKASPENPIWVMVDIRLEEIFPRELTLAELRAEPKLAKMELLKRGSRLSIQPVTADEFQTVMKLAHAAGKQPKAKVTKAKAPAKAKRSTTKARRTQRE